jgi:glycosyltransferase involved in cell wall biosynthesis
MPDLSVVLNVHNETRYLLRTLRSLGEAARFAAAEGIDTELVIVLDRSPADTRALVDGWADDSLPAIRRIAVDNGSLGLSRNDGAEMATGDHLAFADADDLVSFNLLATMLRTARAEGPDAIVIPEYLFEFGAQYQPVRYFGAPLLGPLECAFSHPFVSRILLRRETARRIRFADLRLSSGYAYEDWLFNCEALTEGMRFVVAPATILYYRKRQGSLLNQARMVSLDHIPPTRLARPETYRRIAGPAWERAQDPADAAERRRLADELPQRLGDFLASPLCRELTAAANAIDPAIELYRYGTDRYWSNILESRQTGLAYYRACEIIGDRRFDEVFVLPFMARGGAEKYLLNIMHGLARLWPEWRFLVIGGERIDRQDWLERLPEKACFLDLPALAPDCGDDEIDLLALKLIHGAAPGARIHLKNCYFSLRFWAKFGRGLAAGHQAVFYRFMDGEYVDGGRRFTGGAEFDFVSDQLETLGLLVADNRGIIARDHARFGCHSDRWRYLPTRCEAAATADAIAARPLAPRRRLLWASRLDAQKRPELLPELAARLAARGIDTMIEVRGAPLLGSFDPATLAVPGLDYCGPFGDFTALDHAAYDALLYTTGFDGMPNVVLEALGAGLPVIAPDLGALAEAVRPGETGWLVRDEGDENALLDAYCDAIADLYADPPRARAMALAGHRLIAGERGWPAFLGRLRSIFGK